MPHVALPPRVICKAHEGDFHKIRGNPSRIGKKAEKFESAVKALNDSHQETLLKRASSCMQPSAAQDIYEDSQGHIAMLRTFCLGHVPRFQTVFIAQCLVHPGCPIKNVRCHYRIVENMHVLTYINIVK